MDSTKSLANRMSEIVSVSIYLWSSRFVFVSNLGPIYSLRFANSLIFAERCKTLNEVVSESACFAGV